MRVGVADTTFARVDMAAVAVETLRKAHDSDDGLEIERSTVPGMKDLPVAAKKLIEEQQCEIVLAFGWVGKEEIDEQCANEASTGLITAELMTNTHILKVFVHEREAGDEEKLQAIARDRAAKHALNALALLKGKEELTALAGKGRRQGGEDAGALWKHT